MLISVEAIAVGSVCLAALWIVRVLLDRIKTSRLPLPPFVPLTEDEIRYSPVESMTRALRDHGPIVAIRRNGKKEYITSAEYTRKILTDDSFFSFEDGMAELLGLNWIRLLHGGTFFRDVDSIVRDFSTRRLDLVTPKIWPIFEQGAKKFAKAARPGDPVDVLPSIQSTMAKATINIFLGPKYDNDDYARRVIILSQDIAELMGILDNQSYLARRFPRLWHTLTWFRIVLFRIPRDLGISFARQLWMDICAGREAGGKDENIISHLVHRYSSKDGHLSLSSKMWAMVLVLTILFGSVHQTVVITLWVTYHLALHPDCQQSIHDEVASIVGSKETADAGGSTLGYGALQKAELTESFIREVMRMKGDSVNVVRSTVANVELGGYVIPKGSLVFPVTYLSYRSKAFYADPDDFKATRWIGTGKSAASTGQEYLAFGLGRWSCPGRYLAVVEIKSWILALASCSKFELQDGKYEVVDAYNITAVPPRGRLLVHSLPDGEDVVQREPERAVSSI